MRSDLPAPLPGSPLGRTELPDFLAIFRTHCSFVWRALRSFGVAEHSLDDALQEVFIVVHRRLGEFEGRASLRTWIYAITHRVAHSYRRRSRQQEVDELSSELPASGPTPLEAAERAEAGELVLAFLEGLPDSKRDVFVLCVLEDLPAPEASSILQVNVNTVYSRLRHVRAEFKHMLEDREARIRRANGE